MCPVGSSLVLAQFLNFSDSKHSICEQIEIEVATMMFLLQISILSSQTGNSYHGWIKFHHRGSNIHTVCVSSMEFPHYVVVIYILCVVWNSLTTW